MGVSQVFIGSVSGEHPRGDAREDSAVLLPQALPSSFPEVKLPKTQCADACKVYGEELNRLRMFDFSAVQPPEPGRLAHSGYVAFARAVDELKSMVVSEQESLAVDNPRKLNAEQQEFLLKEIRRIAEETIIGRIAEKNAAPLDENTKERYRDTACVLLDNYREIAADEELKQVLPPVIAAFREQHSADLLALEETCFFGEPNELKQFLSDVQKLKNDTLAHIERFLGGDKVKDLDKSLLQELTPEICARIALEIDKAAQKAILRRIAELGTEGTPRELLGEFAPYFTHDPQTLTPISRYEDPSLQKEHPELIPGGNDSDLAASFLAEVKKLRAIRSDAVCELIQLEEQAQKHYAERQAMIEKNLQDQGFSLKNGSEREQPTAVLNEELSLLEVTKRLLGISDVRLIANDHLELIYRANPHLRAVALSGMPLPPGTLICLSGLPIGEDIRLSCCKQDAVTAKMLANSEGELSFTETAQSLLAAAAVEKEMAVFRKDLADAAFRLRALDPGDKQTANSVTKAFYELRERLGFIKKSAAKLPLEQQGVDNLEREFNSQWIEHTYEAGMRALAAKTEGGAASHLFACCQEKVTELAALEQDPKRLLELRKLQAELHLLEAKSYVEASGRDVFAALEEGWMHDEPGTPGREQVDSLLRQLQKGYADAVKCVRQSPEYQANKAAYDVILRETAASYVKHKAEIQGRAGRAVSQLFSLGLAASHLLGGAEGEHNRLLFTENDQKHYANFTEDTAERTTEWWGTDKLEVLSPERQESISKKAAALEPEKRYELVTLIEEMQQIALAQGEVGKANALREVLKSISSQCQDPVLETRIAIADAQFTFDFRESSQDHAIKMLQKARKSAEAIDVSAREKELAELRIKLLSAESADDQERIRSEMAVCQRQIAQRELLIKQTYSIELQMHAQRVETGPSALRLMNAKRVSELRSEIEKRERSEMRRANEEIAALAEDLAPDAPTEVRAKASVEKQALEAELAARRSSLVELRIFEAATYLRAGEAMSTKQVLNSLEELRDEFKGTPQEQTVSKAIASFSESNNRSKIAAGLQQVLHEATQDTLAENIAWSVGGGAVGVAAFWWGGPPGWAFGYMLGSVTGNLVLKGSNIYAGRDKISQAYKVGMCADGLKESLYAGGSVGLDVITSLAPTAGLGKVGTKGVLALAFKEMLKTELQKIIGDVGVEIAESQLIYLGRRQLLRSALEGTVEFGGSKLMLAGLGLGAAPIAEQVYGIYNASPEQMSAAQKEAALRKIAADASTMVLHLAAMAVLENAIVAGGKTARFDLHQLRKNLNSAAAEQRSAIEAGVLESINETVGLLERANKTGLVDALPVADQSSLSQAARLLGAERSALRPGDAALLAPEKLLGVAKEELSQIVKSRRSIASHPPEVAAAPKGAVYEAAYDWAENRILINTEIGLSPQRLRELIAHEAEHAAQIRAVASAHVQGERLPLCFYDEQGSVNIHPEIIAEVKSRSALPTEFEVRRGMLYAASLDSMLRDRQLGDLASYADAVAERSSITQEQWVRMQDIHEQLRGIDEEIKNAHQSGAAANEIEKLTERRQLLEEEWTKVHRENIENIEELEARLAADEQVQLTSVFPLIADSRRWLKPEVYAGPVVEESLLLTRCENLVEKLDAGEVLSVAEQAELLRSARTLANKGETFYLDYLNDVEQKTPGLMARLEKAERSSESPAERAPVKPASSQEMGRPTVDPGTVVKPERTNEVYNRARSELGRFFDGRWSPSVSERIALVDLLVEAARTSEQAGEELNALCKAAPSDKQAMLNHAALLRGELRKVDWNKLEPGTKGKVLTGLDSVEKAGGSPSHVLKGMKSEFDRVLQNLHALGVVEQGGGAGTQVLAERLARALQQQGSDSRGLELVLFDLTRAARQVLSGNDSRMQVSRRLSTGEVQEMAIKERVVKNGYKAVLASDALRMICEKYGLPIPTGKQIQAGALEEAVDIAILIEPGEGLSGPSLNGEKYPFGEGSYFLAQIKSSTTLAIDHFKYALNRGSTWIPVLMSLPDGSFDIAEALRMACEVGHYPERFKSESADAQTLRDIAAQARYGLPMRSEAPLWLRAYCGSVEDEAKFVARIKRALASPS